MKGRFVCSDDIRQGATCVSPTGEDTPLYEILQGEPDPRLAHLRTVLTLLGLPVSGPWFDAIRTMAGALEAARVEELRPMHRLDAREALEDLAAAAVRIIALTDRSDVLEALGILAPASPREPDDATGYEYLRSIARRAGTAADAIRSGSGRDTLLASLGYPTARLLCATMVRTAWARAKGKAPGDKNSRALEACAALWRASGGSAPLRAELGDTDETAAWERHLKDARLGKKSCAAMLSGCLTAADHQGRLRQKAT